MVVVEGEVVAEAGGKTFTLGESDILAIPGWTWCRYRATQDAILFCFSDRSAQEKLAIWREQRQ